MQTSIFFIPLLKRSDPVNLVDASSLESQIDSLVYRLYGLTAAEIATVEESAK